MSDEAVVASSEIHTALSALEPITAAISDKRLRDDVLALLTAEILARLSLKAIALEPFEAPEYSAPDIDMWDTVAQPVRSALIALIELRKLIGDLAPMVNEAPGADVEVAFDLVDNDPPPAYDTPDNVAKQVDDWVQLTLGTKERDIRSKTPADQWKEVQESLQPLAGILVQESQRFATRLRNPQVVINRWMLLAELQEFKGKFQKLLGALRLGLLHPFTDLPDAELLGDYRTEEQGSVLIRRAFYRLERDVNTLIGVHASAGPEEKRVVLEELTLRLVRFSRCPAFALVRAPDKRAIIEFRKTLVELGPKANARRLSEIFEDLSKFLDMMHGLSRREILERHDRTTLADLRSRMVVVEEVSPLDMESARRLLNEAHALAQGLLGRDPMLDVWIDLGTENGLLCDSKDDLHLLVRFVSHALSRIHA